MNPILKSIKINNLRSISMTESIPFVPITILIGKNSAGKSTFARFFPLLRQSCEAKKRAPILWFGDRVDFGSFGNSLRRGMKKKGAIEFVFELRVVNPSVLAGVHKDGRIKENNIFNATVSISIRSDVNNNRSLASNVNIKALGHELNVVFSETNNLEYIQCDHQEWRPLVTDYTQAVYGSVLPKITILREISTDLGKHYSEHRPFSERITKIVEGGYFHKHEQILSILEAAPVLESGLLSKHVLNRLRLSDKTDLTLNNHALVDVIRSIESMVFASKINELLDIIDNALDIYFSGVKYIEPLRATAQRYYRKQELALDEIDSKGENLAMFLDNLGPWLIGEFNKWTMENFGFSAKTTNEGGHVAIVITEAGDTQASNLADIGFGFSQILPIITQMWFSSRMSHMSKTTSCIVIEQPELHLHPAFQAKLADVFAASIAEEDEEDEEENSPHLIIETHSNYIVNRFGQLISEGKLRHTDVQILVFNKDGESDTRIEKSWFDENGYLMNWPLGFFEPEI